MPTQHNIRGLRDVEVHHVVVAIDHHPQSVVVGPLEDDVLATGNGHHRITKGRDDGHTTFGDQHPTGVVLRVEGTDEEPRLIQIV